MKKVIAWLLVLALTAAVSIGATLAYLTDTDEDVNVMTLGKVKIDQLEYERVDVESKDDDATVQEFHDNKPLLPAVTDKNFDYTPGTSYVDWEQIGKDGYTSDIWDPAKINNEVDKMVFIKNKGDYDAYVRSVFAFEAGKYTTLDEFQKMVHLNLNETDYEWEWLPTPVTIGESTYFVATATYNKVLAPGALTEISLSQIALDKTATNEDVEAFGETYQVLVKSQGIQADGFDDPDFALNEGFGVITSNSIPWKNDSPIRGVDLRTALHYYEGDQSNQITAKVTNVVFGLNNKHTNVVSNYEGTLVDVEQDVPVYAYYVPSSGGYDVYFLADDAVYTPKDSRALFKSMTALQTVDTTNMDVSRTEDMYEMFRGCTKLGNMNLSDWDTGNVTNMQSMFRDCDSITELDLSGWNVEKVENLYTFVYSLDKLTKLDISGWNIASDCVASWGFARNPLLAEVDATGMNTAGITGAKALLQQNFVLTELKGEESWTFPNLTDASWMFESCQILPEVTVGSWNLSALQNASGMFSNCQAFKTLKGSENWRLDSVTDMSFMFQICYGLEYLNATGWNMANCVNMDRTFMSCQSLQAVEGSETWNVGNVETFFGTFYDNKKLSDLDTSTWDTGSATNMSNMFRGDVTLETLNVTNWDVSKVTDFSSMFSSFNQNTGDMKVNNLDISNWKPNSAVQMNHMFYGCGSLTSVDMSNWNVSNLQTVSHMFADCYDLENVLMTNWNTPSLTCMDGMFNNCEAMKTVDLSSFDTSKVREFSQMFEACYSLEYVYGLENFDTSSGHDFSEMFSGCGNLKELNLSTFDTHLADPAYWTYADCENWVFLRFMSGCSSLEKVTFGPSFSFDGKGNCPDSYKFVMPAASNVEGWDGYWYNAATGEKFLPSEIPEMTAATYVAVNPNP